MIFGYDLPKLSPLDEVLKPVKKFWDESYGNTILMTDKYEENDFALLAYRFDKQESLRQAMYALNQRMRLEHKNLIEICDYSATRKNGGWCGGDFFMLHVFYPYRNHSWEKEMKIRKSDGRRFDCNELATFLYEQINVLAYLQSQNYYTGDLRPTSIIVEQSQFENYTRIVERLTYMTDSSLETHRAHFLAGRKLYMSPEVFKAMGKSNKTLMNDQWKFKDFKYDAFSFGLIILESGLINQHDVDLQKIYDKQTFSINQQKLNEYIQRFKTHNKALPLLGKVLDKLLCVDKKHRYDFLELHENLPPKEVVDNWCTGDTFYDKVEPQYEDVLPGNINEIDIDYKPLSREESPPHYQQVVYENIDAPSPLRISHQNEQPVQTRVYVQPEYQDVVQRMEPQIYGGHHVVVNNERPHMEPRRVLQSHFVPHNSNYDNHVIRHAEPYQQARPVQYAESNVTRFPPKHMESQVRHHPAETHHPQGQAIRRIVGGQEVPVQQNPMGFDFNPGKTYTGKVQVFGDKNMNQTKIQSEEIDPNTGYRKKIVKYGWSPEKDHGPNQQMVGHGQYLI